MGTLLRSCVKVREANAIKLTFGLVSGVGSDIRVLNEVRILPGEGEISGVFLVHWFEWRLGVHL